MATHSQSLSNRRRRQKTQKAIKRDAKRTKKAGKAPARKPSP